MANISFEERKNMKKNYNNGSKNNKEQGVGYFSLKSGEEAIVRFAYSTIQDIESQTVHVVKTTNKEGKEFYKRISCLRESLREPTSNCPLCQSGNKMALKVYIKLIEYTQDENKRIVPKAKVWERPDSFVDELANFIEAYGDLTDVLFKVKRTGSGLDTKHTLIYLRNDIYKPEVYVKDFKEFEGFNTAGHSYLIKTASDINTFLQTGELPYNQKTTTNQKPEQSTAPKAQPAKAPTAPVAPTAPTTAEQEKPKGTTNPTEGRPQRYTF